MSSRSLPRVMVEFGGTSSLFLVVLLALINAAPGRRQHIISDNKYRLGAVFLLAFRDTENGVEVAVFPAIENQNIHGRSLANEAQRFVIQGYRLSSDCGDFFFRCQDILVTASIQGDGDRDINVIFVPLENGVLLVKYWFDSNNATVEWTDTSVIDFPVCNPTLFYTENSKIYTLCINSTLQVICAYEIQKLQPMIENATLVGPLSMVSILEPSSLHLSNFVHDNENKVYFADKNTIFVINVQSNQTKKSELSGCTQVHELRPAISVGDEELLLIAYCADKYGTVCFDPIHGNWSSLHTYSNSGIPYLCPNEDYRAVFLNDTERERLQLIIEGLIPKVIHNVSIGDGICFEFENITYFTYSDQNHNSVFVYKFSSQNPYLAMSYECSSTDCPHLHLLDDHYLVVRVTENVYVLDAKDNFSLIINTTGILDTSIVTVIQVNKNHETYPTIVVTPFSRNFTTTTWPFSDNTAKIVIPVIVFGTLIFIVIIIAIFVVMSLRLVKKRR